MKIKKEERQRQQNRRYETLIRNSFKEVEKISSTKNFPDNDADRKLEIASRYAQKIVDKASRKGLIHKKNASRKVRRISNIVNSFKKEKNSPL